MSFGIKLRNKTQQKQLFLLDPSCPGSGFSIVYHHTDVFFLTRIFLNETLQLIYYISLWCFQINIHLNVLKLQICLTYHRLNIICCIIPFLDNSILHHHQAHLQSTDQLQACLPSDQDCNNVLSPSSAAVNYVGCGTGLIFPSLSPGGNFINSRALHQIQSGGLVMRSHTSRA